MKKLLKKIVQKDTVILFIITLFLTIVWGYRIDLAQSLWSDVLPFAAWFNDKSLFPNDLYASCFPYMFTLFYQAFGKLSQLTSPNFSLLVFLFIQNLLAVFAVYYLSLTLFKSKKTAYLSLAWLFLAGGLKYGLGGTLPFGVNVNPSMLAIPLLLFSVNLFLKRKYFWSIVLLGFIYNLHLSLSLITSFAFLSCFIWEWKNMKKEEKRPLFWGSLIGVILILPTLIQVIFASYPKEGLLSNKEWFYILKIRNVSHSYPSRFGLSQWFPFLFLVTSWFFLSKRKIFSFQHREVCHLIAGVFLLCVIGTIFTEIFPARFFVTLYPFRGTFLFGVLLFIYLSHYSEKVIFGKKLPFVDTLNRALLPIFFIILSIVRLNMVPAFRFLDFNDFPGFKFYSLKEKKRDFDWLDIQKWVAKNTPKNNLILTPPELRGFRAYSQRGIVIAWEDVNYPIYYPHTGKEILKRLKDFGIDIFSYKSEEEATNTLSLNGLGFKERDFKRLGEKYNVSFLVTYKNKNLNFPTVYKNDIFKVYKIK